MQIVPMAPSVQLSTMYRCPSLFDGVVGEDVGAVGVLTDGLEEGAEDPVGRAVPLLTPVPVGRNEPMTVVVADVTKELLEV